MKNKKVILQILILIVVVLIICLIILEKTGTLRKIGMSQEQLLEEEAKIKIEQALNIASQKKQEDAAYNSDTYLTKILQSESILVNGNIVSIDEYNFEIDRENLSITKSIGKTQVTVTSAYKEYVETDADGNYVVKVDITINSNIPIDSIMFENDNGTITSEKTTELAYTKEMTIKTDKNYVITVVTSDGKVNNKQIKQAKNEVVIPPKVENPTTSTAIRTGNAITYTWYELNQIAKIISNQASDKVSENIISSDTAEVTVTLNGETKTLGIGDYTTISGKNVRIIGFNHDTLVDNTAYGGTNTYAGISFEYVRFLDIDELQTYGYSGASSVSWGGCNERRTLNGTLYNAVKSVVGENIIKKVSKPYCANYYSSTISFSQDYLWLLSCAEIYGAKAISPGIEGTQYKYYKNIAPIYSTSNSYLLKNSGAINTATVDKIWWLRSRYSNNSGQFLYITQTGICSSRTNYDSAGIAPGFSI